MASEEVTPGAVQTLTGSPFVASQIAAVMTLALPSTAFAIGLPGFNPIQDYATYDVESSAAICSRLLSASSLGSTNVPADT